MSNESIHVTRYKYGVHVCVCVCVCVHAIVVDKVTVGRVLSADAAERGLAPAASLEEKNIRLIAIPPTSLLFIAHPTPPYHLNVHHYPQYTTGFCRTFATCTFEVTSCVLADN